MDKDNGIPPGDGILVVDDEPGLRKIVARRLKRSGYNVIEAEDGPAAESIWSGCSEKIKLLLTDLRMPSGFNGIELARRLQAQQPELKVLFMTGYSDDLLESGRHLVEDLDFVCKPFGMGELIDVIQNRLTSENRPLYC